MPEDKSAKDTVVDFLIKLSGGDPDDTPHNDNSDDGTKGCGY